MRLILVTATLVFAMPITGFGWAEGTNLLLEPNLVCKKTKRLRGKLYRICKYEAFLMKEITKGINLGFKECEYQFKYHRWNCTSSNKKSIRKILIRDTRETSFVNAITAAGVTYAVTRACTMGDLVECSCDKNHLRRLHYNTNNGNNNNNNNNQDNNNEEAIVNIRNRNNNNQLHNLKNRNFWKNNALSDGDWQWGGCGDNVNFGVRKSKDFLDARYRRKSDIKTLVKLHNHHAGRMTVRNMMRLECKCHGLSGSCTMKTCWMKMPPFREIGNRLKERFDGAAKVIARNDGHSFMPEGLTIKTPTRRDLVYTDESMDFCKLNIKTGSIGTMGRECNATSMGIDGCDLLCCNRGYDRKIIREKVNCNCTFKWCCEVTCSTCIERREVFTCR